VLMPLSRCEDGYYSRFREDGSVVPWALDRVNLQLQEDGQEPISALRSSHVNSLVPIQ